jgi:hypothetical protein
MKRMILFGGILLAIAACNSKKEEGKKPGTKTEAELLMDSVEKGHDVGMSKYGKMKGLQQQVNAALDSISKLPAKARQEAAPYEHNLKSVAEDLNTAVIEMDHWMENFNMDSALNNMQERVRYLTDEKSKIGRIKGLILESVQKADSILRK